MATINSKELEAALKKAVEYVLAIHGIAGLKATSLFGSNWKDLS